MNTLPAYDACFSDVHCHLLIRIQQHLVQRPEQIRIIQEATTLDLNFRQGGRQERQLCTDGAVLFADFFGYDWLRADPSADDDLSRSRMAWMLQII